MDTAERRVCHFTVATAPLTSLPAPSKLPQNMRTAIWNKPLRAAWPLFLLATILVQRTSLAGEYFLFTSFRGNGEDGLHLATSTNGYRWDALKNDQSFLKPEVGAGIMRDPCLAQGPDGTFHMVWTCGWTTEKGKVIGYAQSKDLVHWSGQKAIPLMENDPATRNIWAPEIFYEPEQKRWLVFWSSTIPGRFPDTDQTGDDGYNHRLYCATTTDFQNFTGSRLLYDPGFNVIDATLLRAGGNGKIAQGKCRFPKAIGTAP